MKKVHKVKNANNCDHNYKYFNFRVNCYHNHDNKLKESHITSGGLDTVSR